MLRLCLLATLWFSLSPAGAVMSQDGEMPDPRDQLVAEQAKHLCHSTEEYIKTLTFLRANHEVAYPEKTARLIAEKVSRGCDGASERFSKVLLLLKGVGLSDPKSLEMALRFSGYPPDVQKNFTEIFTRAFLAEFFDYDYTMALALALELSKDYKGDPAQVREDFIQLAQFCKDGKSVDFPTRTCAAYAIKLAQLSDIFPQGIRQPFLDFYKKLREDRDFTMDRKSALEVTYNVLKSGPRAPENFTRAYAFAMKQDGLALGHNQALEFALRMAARSYDGRKPPIIPGVASAANP